MGSIAENRARMFVLCCLPEKKAHMEGFCRQVEEVEAEVAGVARSGNHSILGPHLTDGDPVDERAVGDHLEHHHGMAEPAVASIWPGVARAAPVRSILGWSAQQGLRRQFLRLQMARRAVVDVVRFRVTRRRG